MGSADKSGNKNHAKQQPISPNFFFTQSLISEPERYTMRAMYIERQRMVPVLTKEMPSKDNPY